MDNFWTRTFFWRRSYRRVTPLKAIGELSEKRSAGGENLLRFLRHSLCTFRKFPLPFATGTLASYTARQSRAANSFSAAYSPSASQLLQTPPSPIRTALAWSICLFFMASIGASYFGHLEIEAVAPARIQPQGRSKVIQPLNGGFVRSIAVHEGSQVRVGAPLVELDTRDTDADLIAARDHLASLDAEIARRRALLDMISKGSVEGRPIVTFPLQVSTEFRERELLVMTSDIAKLLADTSFTDAKIKESEQQSISYRASLLQQGDLIDTLRKRVAMRTGLQRDGWDTQANVLDATETLQRQLSTQVEMEGNLAKNAATIVSLREQRRQTVSQLASDYAQALEKAEAQRDAAMQDFTKAKSKDSYMRLLSPISGTVQQLVVTTLGQVVGSGEQLMTIVPDKDKLEVTALLSSHDVGFVKVGQRAEVKVDSFPFTRYGTLPGTVIAVSRDSLQSSQASTEQDTQIRALTPHDGAASPVPATQQLVFPVTISLDRSYFMIDGSHAPIGAGMTGVAEIKTGERRVIEYFLSPLIATQSEAAHER